MKKILFIITAILFYSCSIVAPIKAPSVYMGMTVMDFIKIAKNEQLVEMSDKMTVYRVTHGFYADQYKFYYFINNRLVQVNEGQRKTDQRIRLEIDSN